MRALSLRPAGLVLSGILFGVAALCGTVLPAGPAAATPTGWHITPSPNGRGGNELAAVSCRGPRFCAAVGDHLYAGTLAEIWDGQHWSIAPTASPGHEPDRGTLTGVSCASATFCAAVGYYSASLDERTLIEIWNGHRWSVSRSRSPSDYSHLLGVSCTSPRDCEAVGFYLDDCSPHSSGSAGLVERWNGRVWSVVPSPRHSCRLPELQAVSCSVPSSCAAVGAWGQGTGTGTFTEFWDGTRWSVVPSPNGQPGNNNTLDAVSCTGEKPSKEHCMAVGYYQRVYAGPALTLAERWNGTKWSIVATPGGHPKDSSFLAGVSCTSAANCVAAGSRADGFGNADTLVESWNGSAWSVTSSPDIRAAQQLFGVVCTGASSCQAVGYDGKDTDLPARTLVETGS